jgi:hypothetical protein
MNIICNDFDSKISGMNIYEIIVINDWNNNDKIVIFKKDNLIINKIKKMKRQK